MAKIINDLHYNGKTVDQRLATEGLLEQFQAALKANDIQQMVGLMKQVLITNAWATRLASMILTGPSQPPIHLNEIDPRNAGAFRQSNELKFPACMRPAESPRDPYWNLGSHPDVVGMLWDKLAAALPEDCRCIVFGSPALVAPRSGILLAKAMGTQSILRIPREAMDDAMRSGAKTKMIWAQSRVTDLSQEYGEDWIFNCSLKQRTSWLIAVYNFVEMHTEEPI